MEEQSSSSPQAHDTNVVPGAIILAGVMIAAAIMYTQHGASPQNNGAVVTPNAPVIAGTHNAQDLIAHGAVLGNPDAKVTVVEFSDFQCPFCGRFFSTVEPQLFAQYLKTGKIKFVYRHFAFLGDESEWAGEAAECARDQGKFWEYHDYLFTHQNGENEGAFTKDNLKIFAKTLGLNQDQFSKCLDTDKYLAQVKQDTEDGRIAGVTGTPTNFINTQMLTGAVPFSDLQKAIDKELTK